ncbi:MAG: LemA family protein [Candidatus Latescibacterota bacterium]|nr:MAG: LemA family protein [Candidatus Latescibacterota bacterium]
MKAQVALSLVVILIVILAVLSLVLVFNYNGIIKAEKRVEEAKADIEAACQRRMDLIPNLVQTVKGYAQHESNTLIAVTQARQNAQEILKRISSKKTLNKEDISALVSSQSTLMGSLKNLFALAENYPDLKASSNFLALQDQLEGTENRINVARQRYNSVVRTYNTKIETFPGNIFAAMFGFGRKEYFEAKAEALEPVKVEF